MRSENASVLVRVMCRHHLYSKSMAGYRTELMRILKIHQEIASGRRLTVTMPAESCGGSERLIIGQ